MLPALAVAGALLLVGCGDDQESPATGSEAETTESAALPEQAGTDSEPQETPVDESGESGSASSTASSPPAGRKLTKAVEDALAIFLPPDQTVADVSCVISSEQEGSGGTSQQELTCTYETTDGLVQSQKFQALDTGDGSPTVLPLR